MNSPAQNKTRTRTWVFVLILLIIAFALGFIMRGGGTKTAVQSQGQDAGEEARIKFWTCSMHPQIQQPGPGQCPLCGMDLIPVSSESGADAGPREHKLSAHAIKLAEIQTAPVERKFVTAVIRMDGKVDYDETRLSYITAWVPGRIEQLYVDYTGVAVQKGDHLVALYSPELRTAQQELLLGLKMVKNKTSRLRESTLKNVEATREKLRLWGLTNQQISRIEKSGRISDRTTIYSPISGIVIHKNGFEGMYVDTGTRIYTVADLSQVWIKLDAYESDLMWIRYGQEVEFETKAYPGEIFKGQITFIDPVLNPKTRTVKVRVNVSNLHGKLKPDMFVTARVYPQVAAGGKVMDSALAGKWVCPMHPEIVKDKKDRCDLCGMDLVTTESLGYSAAEVPDDAPLVIPATAPLITGKRAVVYVVVPEKEGTFEGREIVLGPRAGGYYVVKDGLKEGEQVVVNGNFKIDSALQIMAKPSMMSPQAATPAGDDEIYQTPDAFKSRIDTVVTAYFDIHHGLSKDNYKEAVDTSRNFIKSLEEVDMKLLRGKAHLVWMQRLETLKKHAGAISAAKDIAAAREHFSPLSDTLYQVTKQFGTAGQKPIYRFHCPMAFDNQGAYWLQSAAETENPYYGSMMYRCGSKVDTISTGIATDQQMEGHDHD